MNFSLLLSHVISVCAEMDPKGTVGTGSLNILNDILVSILFQHFTVNLSSRPI